jgi:uncharacterized membrane protein
MRWNVCYWQSAALAGFAGLADVLGEQRIRVLNDAWWHAGGIVIIVLIQLYKWYARYTEGTAAVLPKGLVLSFIMVCILLFTGWKGWEMVSSRGRYVRASNKAALDCNTAKSRLIKLRKGMDY